MGRLSFSLVLRLIQLCGCHSCTRVYACSYCSRRRTLRHVTLRAFALWTVASFAYASRIVTLHAVMLRAVGFCIAAFRASSFFCFPHFGTGFFRVTCVCVRLLPFVPYFRILHSVRLQVSYVRSLLLHLVWFCHILRSARLQESYLRSLALPVFWICLLRHCWICPKRSGRWSVSMPTFCSRSKQYLRCHIHQRLPYLGQISTNRNGTIFGNINLLYKSVANHSASEVVIGG